MDVNGKNSITIKCGNLTLNAHRSILIKESGYFRALMEGSYADSTNSEHTVHPEMVKPEMLRFMLEWLVQGEPSDLHNWTVEAIIQSTEACEVLQMENILKRLWEVAAAKLNPDNCIMDAKLYCTPSSGADGFMKLLWNSVQWNFFELVWCDKILSELTEAELYWILRNPYIVEPTGGVLALILIDIYVRHHFLNFGSGDQSADSSNKAISMTARLVFALLESIEARVAADPPEHYVPKAISLGNCDGNCASCSKNEMSLSESRNLHVPDSAASVYRVREEASSTSKPRFLLPLSCRDIQIISKNRQDNNVFHLMYNTQKKTPWKACFADQTVSTEQEPSTPHAPLWSYDEETQVFEPAIKTLSAPSGARLCAYGHDLLVVGGEQNHIGSNKFCSYVQRYCFLSKKWSRIQLAEPLCHRSFNFCWLASKGLLLQGGYKQYRQHNNAVLLLQKAYDHLKDCSSDEDDEGPCGNEVECFSLKRPTKESFTSSKKYKAHTFKYDDVLTLESARFSPASRARTTIADAMVFASGGHVCLLGRTTLNIYCPISCAWSGYFLMKAHLWQSVGSYIGAFPYGTGVYVVDFELRVYFIPLCVGHSSGRAEGTTSQCPSMGYRIFLYSHFKCCGSQLCRVQDKLYLSGQQSNEQPPVVEVLPLLYDPLAPKQQADRVSRAPSGCTSSQTSTGASAASSSAADSSCPPSGLNCEKPAVLQSSSTDAQNKGEFISGTLTSSEVNSTRIESCSSEVHFPVTSAFGPELAPTLIHRSTPAEQAVLPNVLPTAASIRRAAAAQHRLLDDGLLQSALSCFGAPQKLTPAGEYAAFLVEEMKGNTYPNWVISDSEFSLPPGDISLKKEETCAFCVNFSMLTHAFGDDEYCTRSCDTYIDRPKSPPPLVPLPGCNAFPILKN